MGLCVTEVVGFEGTDAVLKGSVEDKTVSTVVAMLGLSFTVVNGFAVVEDEALLELELAVGFVTVMGLFPGELGFFVVTVGLLVLLVVGFLVLLMGLLVDWVNGFAVVLFLGGNLVTGTVL